MSLRKRISLFFSLMSMVARRLKLRFRDLPEKRAAIKAALMISDTAKLMMSRFLFMMSVNVPPRYIENQFETEIIAESG